jgi:hypothetical protein
VVGALAHICIIDQGEVDEEAYRGLLFDNFWMKLVITDQALQRTDHWHPATLKQMYKNHKSIQDMSNVYLT